LATIAGEIILLAAARRDSQVMLGFSLLGRDALKIELFHVQSGARFTYLLWHGKLTDKYFVAPDLSGDFGPPDHAAIEGLAVLARKAAILLMANGPPAVAGSGEGKTPPAMIRTREAEW
jgi:hypothetical protein